MDAPHNFARYTTGSFTTVQSWDQAGPTCALYRSRSQEKGRTEASDRRCDDEGADPMFLGSNLHFARTNGDERFFRC